MLNPDFKDMLSCLNGEQVEFIIVGAYALAAHGHVRATGDIDIWVRNSASNATKIIRALKTFGAPTANISETDFLLPDLILQIGVVPCRINIITGIDGISFDDAWQNKMAVTVDGVNVHVLSKSDLLKNKTAAGRDKDQWDIAWLKKNP
ncbi:MAG: nucleotidyltransferase [Acidobacteriota bacterium]